VIRDEYLVGVTGSVTGNNLTELPRAHDPAIKIPDGSLANLHTSAFPDVEV
jgi:hypothetical protein